MRVLLSLTLVLATQLELVAAPSPPYNLQRARATALANHPSLRGAEAKVTAAEAQRQQARAGYSVKVEASAGYTRLDADPSFTIAPFGKLVYGEASNEQAAVTAQLPLLTGGKLDGVNRQAEAGVALSQHSLTRRRQEVALAAAKAYFRAQQARRMVTVAEAQVKALQSQRDAVAKMLDRGVVTKIDLLRAETGVAGAEEFLARARNNAALSLAALANALGLPAETPVTLTDAVEDPADAQLPETLAAATTEALGQRPELHVLEAQQTAAKAGVEVARSDARPTVGLFAQYDFQRPTFMPETGDWSLGLVAKMNLFDGGATEAAVSQAQAQVAQVDAGREELRNGIQLQVTQAWLNVGSAQERVRTAEKAVATAEEGLRLVRLGYANEVNTMTDFLAAQAELTAARSQLVTAQFDVLSAQAELVAALGR